MRWGCVITLLNAILTVGKVIGGAKSLKNIYDFATEDREKRRRQKEKQAEAKRQKELIQTISERNVIETLFIYIVGCVAAIWLASLGVIGALVVLLFYLVHINGLYKIFKRVSVMREGILTTISLIVVVISMVI